MKYIYVWDRRKEKKARFKKKIARLRKRGWIAFGGFTRFSNTIFPWEPVYTALIFLNDKESSDDE